MRRAQSSLVRYKRARLKIWYGTFLGRILRNSARARVPARDTMNTFTLNDIYTY
jgi:hypothetical protein